MAGSAAYGGQGGTGNSMSGSGQSTKLPAAQVMTGQTVLGRKYDSATREDLAQSQYLPVVYGRAKISAIPIERFAPSVLITKVWAENENYVIGDLIIGSDGTIWRCYHAGPRGYNQPHGPGMYFGGGTDTACWQYIFDTNALTYPIWAPEAIYRKGDRVWCGAISGRQGTTKNECYECTASGTSAAGANLGPGGYGTGISDGTVTWKHFGSWPKASYVHPCVFALCEGPISHIETLWLGDERIDFDAAQKAEGYVSRGLYFSDGDGTQTLPTLFDASGYPYTALLYGEAFYSGTEQELPEIFAEVTTAEDGLDLNPADIFNIILSGGRTGVSWGGTYTADKTANGYWTYCDQVGLKISYKVEDQTMALEVLSDILMMTNSDCVYSGGVLKIVPLDDTATGDYSPSSTAIYDLGPYDFLEPIQIDTRAASDCASVWPVSYIDRLSDYSQVTVEDQDLPALLGGEGSEMRAGVVSSNIIANDGSIALRQSRILAQRSMRVRNEFTLRLSWRYVLIEPTDILSITDQAIGLDQYTVRVTRVEEGVDGITVIAEDYPGGVAYANFYAPQVGDGYSPRIPRTIATLPSLVNGTNLDILNGFIRAEHLHPSLSRDGNALWNGSFESYPVTAYDGWSPPSGWEDPYHFWRVGGVNRTEETFEGQYAIKIGYGFDDPTDWSAFYSLYHPVFPDQHTYMKEPCLHGLMLSEPIPVKQGVKYGIKAKYKCYAGPSDPMGDDGQHGAGWGSGDHGHWPFVFVEWLDAEGQIIADPAGSIYPEPLWYVNPPNLIAYIWRMKSNPSRLYSYDGIKLSNVGPWSSPFGGAPASAGFTGDTGWVGDNNEDYLGSGMYQIAPYWAKKARIYVVAVRGYGDHKDEPCYVDSVSFWPVVQNEISESSISNKLTISRYRSGAKSLAMESDLLSITDDLSDESTAYLRVTDGGEVMMPSSASVYGELWVSNDGTQSEPTANRSFKCEHWGSNFVVRPSSAGGTATVIENSSWGDLIINPGGGDYVRNLFLGSTLTGKVSCPVSLTLESGAAAMLKTIGLNCNNMTQFVPCSGSTGGKEWWHTHTQDYEGSSGKIGDNGNYYIYNKTDSRIEFGVSGTDGKIYSRGIAGSDKLLVGSSGWVTNSDLDASTVSSHLSSSSNPHGVTYSQVGAAAASHGHTISEVSDATTVGQNLVKLTNPGAVTFPRFNADNTVDAISATTLAEAIGAEASGATATHAALTTGVHGLGGASQLNVGTTTGTVAAGDDGRFTDARTPTAHTASHKHGGDDEIATATPTANAIPKADAGGSLNAWVSVSLSNPMSALGDTIYGGASGTPTKLAGNTTTTQKVLAQTGDGTNSAAPVWQAVTTTGGADSLVKTNASGGLVATGPITISRPGTEERHHDLLNTTNNRLWRFGATTSDDFFLSNYDDGSSVWRRLLTIDWANNVFQLCDDAIIQCYDANHQIRFERKSSPNNLRLKEWENIILQPAVSGYGNVQILSSQANSNPLVVLNASLTDNQYQGIGMGLTIGDKNYGGMSWRNHTTASSRALCLWIGGENPASAGSSAVEINADTSAVKIKTLTASRGIATNANKELVSLPEAQEDYFSSGSITVTTNPTTIATIEISPGSHYLSADVTLYSGTSGAIVIIFDDTESTILRKVTVDDTSSRVHIATHRLFTCAATSTIKLIAYMIGPTGTTCKAWEFCLTSIPVGG